MSFDGKITADEEISLAVLAEQSGIELGSPVVNLYLRDGITTAAAVLARTKRLRVTTGTVSPYLWHPAIIAVTAGRLQSLGGGRGVIVLATGMPEALGRAGVTLRTPLARIRETVAILRGLFAGGPFDFSGDIFQLRGYRLSEVPDPPPPIWVAAMGSNMLELAGEVADGALLPGACPPEYVSWAVQRVAAGAQRADRSPHDIEIACNVVVEAGSDNSNWFHARQLAAFHLASPYFERVVSHAGISVDQTGIKSAFQARDWGEVARHVPDKVLERFAAVGSGRQCLDRLEAYHKAGAGLPVMLPVGPAEKQLLTVSNICQANATDSR